MGPLQVFVLLAAVSCTLCSDDSLKLEPWVPKLQGDVYHIKLPVLKSSEGRDSIIMQINQTGKYYGNIQPMRLDMEERALGCGSYLLNPGQSVEIRSKNFPSKYPRNEQCYWSFESTSPNSTISIACKPFKLKKCKWSYLALKGGNLEKIFCGKKKKRGIQESSSDNKMEVYFFSRRRKAIGFKCTVTASDPMESECTPCGIVNRAPRIMNGVETEVNEYPWQVALVPTGTSDTFCGAVVYNDRFILTAGFCLQTIINGNIAYEAVFGAHDLTNPTSSEQRIPVISGTYQNFNNATIDNDIALLELATPVTLSKLVNPPCLPNANEDYAGLQAIASGWGRTENGTQSNVLLEATIPTISNTECNDAYGSFFAITENMICAGYSDTNQNICFRDNGGPLIVEENGQWTLIGLSSWLVNRCSSPNRPSGFTRVSRYLDFMATTAASGQDNSCSKK